MTKRHCPGLFGVLIVIGLLAGCRPDAPQDSTRTDAPLTSSRGYFQTQFQSESQFIVEAVVTDLAEQIFYAATRRLPDAKSFLVFAKEKPGASPDAPVYEMQINFDDKHPGLKLDLNVTGPIWSPEVYRELAAKLAQAVGLGVKPATKTEDTSRLSRLIDGSPETLERENQALSEALEKDFSDPELHEQAALLLGAFVLREHSGKFFEIRSPLSRLTAHLTLARYLSGGTAWGINGRLAEATMLTVVNDGRLALERLKSVDTNNAAVASLVRALQTLSTGDYRIVSAVRDRSRVESLAWFSMFASFVNAPTAWVKLDEQQKQIIDFVRAANENSYSVEMGHELLQAAIPLELQEIQSVYKLSHREKLSQEKLAAVLNELPEHCFDPKGRVRVIGWGQWAMFFQRHLCHAVQQNFYFMNSKWAVPDDAKEFAAKCDQEFGALRLYPFVRRFNCTDVQSYHKAVDQGFKVTVATPHLVPAECWNFLCYKVPFAALYKPNPNPHVNEWHSHNPPPGTVYDLQPRLDHPSLTDRSDVIARFEQLHELTPCDCSVANYLLDKKYTNSPTYDQAMSLYRPLLPYSVFALCTVANTVYDQPDQYEKFMLQAAALSPGYYYDLGNYALNHNQEDKCAEYTDKACDNDPDAVRVANTAQWRINFYLKKGLSKKAREIADFAGEVYSAAGLTAKAVFLEATTNYDGAFEWFAKIEERYNEPGPLMAFCSRYGAKTGDSRFAPELQKRLNIYFPKGMEKVSIIDFSTAPTDGAAINGQNNQVRAAGLRRGDVIVAVGGVRTRSYAQYSYIRDIQPSGELTLIVWQNNGYHEIKASPPNRRFGVSLGDYRSN